ncbi:AMP-dependent synthetase [Parafrankia soli]|uniref:AMP-dependent synthetase n=1 Tax=Parafrankia soli TaxID=2599596 RepID=A0A1S1R916_9ACTN|nr:alpha/beta fold hydrolase [Parafrankia soli]OHV42241.1 AMP-dependent synthetase [Parafrankia soli]
MVGTHPLAVLAANLAEPDPTIVGRFSRIVTARANDIAVRDEKTVLSYAELDSRSSALARSLVVEGDGGNIGILLGQGAPAIVAMLGALKAGRPFVPLDPMLPAARLGQILRLAGVATCVTDSAHTELLAAARLEAADTGPTPGPEPGTVPGSEHTLIVDDGPPVGTAEIDDDLLPGRRALPTDPAFLVFSSGSTGVPKGVVWRNRTVMKDLDAGIERVGMNAADQIALVLPTAFAAGITVMFWGLLCGATLHPFDPRARGIGAMPAWLVDRGITTLHLTPSLMRALAGAAEPGLILGDLRAVTSSGEAVYGRDVAALRELLPTTCTFYNWSGSTETASLAFFPVGSGDEIPAGPLPAGWAVDGKDIEIVDEHGKPVPDGATGEISVTSRYLSGGYWNAPEMTAQRFRPVHLCVDSPADGLRDSGALVSGDEAMTGPASPADSAGPDHDLPVSGVTVTGEIVLGDLGSHEVVYRGGDLARRRPDGCIELLGRADAAVKIRGYLVEPAEIETVLLTSPDVLEAVVVAERVEGEPPRLVAYVVCATAVKSATVAIRGLLREKLPAYMVPSSVILLNELPRNERGKIDRPALPAPPPRPPARRPTGRSHWEFALCDLFAQILKVDEVGVDDDFLELGGDSLLAQQLLSEIATRLGVTLPTSVLVEAPTVAALAARVAGSQRGIPTHPTCVPLNVDGSRPPLFCVAGAGGLAINFLGLSRLLGSDQRVYGLQAQGMESRALPDWSVERHARRHLAVLRVIQPTGPYYLAGFSFGGLVALEMAHMLAAAGEEVGTLLLLDTTLPRSAQSAGGARPSGDPSGGGRITRLLPDRLPLPNASKLRKAARLPLTGLVRYPGLVQFDVFFDQARFITQSYRVRPYAGRTVLYLAEDNPESGRDEWPTHLTGDSTIVTVPGEHHTMLNEPNVSVLAADMRARLGESMQL